LLHVAHPSQSHKFVFLTVSGLTAHTLQVIHKDAYLISITTIMSDKRFIYQMMISKSTKLKINPSLFCLCII